MLRQSQSSELASLRSREVEALVVRSPLSKTSRDAQNLTIVFPFRLQNELRSA